MLLEMIDIGASATGVLRGSERGAAPPSFPNIVIGTSLTFD
jgi:hypothetical protein